MKIRLHIDRLVLYGLPADGLRPDVLHEQVTAELDRLVRERGLHREMQRPGAHPRIPGGELVLPKAPEASSMGKDIARSVFQAIGPMERASGKQPQGRKGR